MQIVGRKNLELVKRAFQNHLVYLLRKSIQASDEEARKRLEPEIKETKAMIDADKIKLNLIKED